MSRFGRKQVALSDTHNTCKCLHITHAYICTRHILKFAHNTCYKQPLSNVSLRPRPLLPTPLTPLLPVAGILGLMHSFQVFCSV